MVARACWLVLFLLAAVPLSAASKKNSVLRLKPLVNEKSPGGGRRTLRFDDGEEIDLGALMATEEAVMAAGDVGVIVLGCGHSGTSTVAGWFAKHGWKNSKNVIPSLFEEKQLVAFDRALVDPMPSIQSGEHLPTTVESVGEIAAGAQFSEAGKAKIVGSRKVTAWYKQHMHRYRPYIMKDPRTVWTLHFWSKVFAAAGELPLLVHVRRPAEDIEKSHISRNEDTTRVMVDSRIAWAEWQLEQWAGVSVSLDTRSLANAEKSNVYGEKEKHPARKPPGRKGRAPPKKPERAGR